MSQQNGFGSGFVLGSLVGGVVGGVLGTVIATRKEKQIGKTDYQLQTGQEMPFSTEESIELARHGLEDKIAQLNLAIDDVRQQLGTVKDSSEQD
jgi:gas vesicle protein